MGKYVGVLTSFSDFISSAWNCNEEAHVCVSRLFTLDRHARIGGAAHRAPSESDPGRVLAVHARDRRHRRGRRLAVHDTRAAALARLFQQAAPALQQTLHRRQVQVCVAGFFIWLLRRLVHCSVVVLQATRTLPPNRIFGQATLMQISYRGVNNSLSVLVEQRQKSPTSLQVQQRPNPGGKIAFRGMQYRHFCTCALQQPSNQLL